MKYIFNMFTGSQRGYGEVGTRTEIETFHIVPDGYLVAFAAYGVEYFKIRKHRVFSLIGYAELLCGGKLVP